MKYRCRICDIESENCLHPVDDPFWTDSFHNFVIEYLARPKIHMGFVWWWEEID